MRTSAIFGAKTLIFRNLWCARTDKEVSRFKPVRTLFGQG